jgi:4-hydroxy-tetrahydrodipicolinate reductase
MKKINLAITGCMGRMGQQIIKSAKSDKNFKVVKKTGDFNVSTSMVGKLAKMVSKPTKEYCTA